VAIRVVSVAVVVSAALALGLGEARSAPTSSCPARTVAANSAQWSTAKQIFGVAFARIKTYLLNPTIANQARMYSRVDTNLFEYYSYAGGQLNASNGKVRGGFAWKFVDGSQCFDRATKKVSFRVRLTAHFTSTNRDRLSLTQLATVNVKPPRITYYQQVPGTH